MTRTEIAERRLIAAGLLALGLSFAGLAGASLRLAGRHMAEIGAICGEAAPHCGWCVAAVAAAAAAVATAGPGLMLLAGRRLRPVRVRTA